MSIWLILAKKPPKSWYFLLKRYLIRLSIWRDYLKLHYPPTVYTISIPCSSGVKTSWILRAFEKGFDGVFIAADGSDCPYGESCTEKTGNVISRTHELMKKSDIEPARLRMAAICSVCSESFVKQMKSFNEYLLKNSNI